MMSDDGDHRHQQEDDHHSIEDDDPWDALCTDPHASFLEQGRLEGARAGRDSGYQTGYDMGRITAIDTGLELGFIRGVVASLMTKDQSTPTTSISTSERALRTIQELQELVNDFPTVDQVFREQERERRGAASDDDDDSEQPQADSRSVRNEIQRIRAKFKLLTVQLGCPHFSLKQVMDEAAAVEEAAVSDTAAATNAPSKNGQISEW